MLPPPVIEQRGDLQVVRDDLLPGGTKMRFMLPVLARDPAEEFVYASPAYGYAQVALAATCAMLGKRATVFTAKRKVPHRLTQLAHAHGAKVVLVPHGYLNVVQARARDYARAVGAKLIPFGVDMPEALDAIAEVARAMPVQPTQVWTVSGSGVLTRGLQRGWPGAEFCTVLIGKEGSDTGRARRFKAPESFEQDAKHPPPFPSCRNYDAKAWQFIRQHAAPGALFWNVGA